MPAPTPLLAPSPNTAQTAVAVTPSDGTNQAVPFRALWIGGTGNVNIAFADGTNAIFTAVPTGYMLAVGGVRVNATSTTATSILAVY